MSKETPAGEWLRDSNMLYRLNEHGNNCDEITVAMVNESREPFARANAAARLMMLIEADRELRRGDASPTGKLIDDLKKASEQIALAGHAGWGNLCNDAQAALAALTAERDALRKDAERYAHILDCDFMAAEKYLPALDPVAHKANLRIKHDAAIAKEMAK